MLHWPLGVSGANRRIGLYAFTATFMIHNVFAKTATAGLALT